VPLFPTTDGSAKSRRFERRRLVLWFGIAVAFHAALLLGLWLMPALRIKWEPSPDAWVQVTSVPKSRPTPPVLERAGTASVSKLAAPQKAPGASAPSTPRRAPDGSAAPSAK
jgi:cytoskeletal protein RodZ